MQNVREFKYNLLEINSIIFYQFSGQGIHLFKGNYKYVEYFALQSSEVILSSYRSFFEKKIIKKINN